MINLSACIEMIHNDKPFADRIKAVKADGLKAVEFWGWANKDLDAIREVCAAEGMSVAAMCIDARDADTAAERAKYPLVYAEGCDPFIKASEETIAQAKKLGVQTIITTVGQARIDATRYEQHTNIVKNLRRAARMFEDAGIILVVEPLNILKNHKGYYLDSSYEAFGIIDEVDSPNVRLLFDIYHQQISEGNIIPNITKNAHLIGHFHAADNPGRFEPGTGELNYRRIFAEIDKLDYKGYVGLEYFPSKASSETLADVIALTK